MNDVCKRRPVKQLQGFHSSYTVSLKVDTLMNADYVGFYSVALSEGNGNP